MHLWKPLAIAGEHDCCGLSETLVISPLSRYTSVIPSQRWHTPSIPVIEILSPWLEELCTLLIPNLECQAMIISFAQFYYTNKIVLLYTRHLKIVGVSFPAYTDRLHRVYHRQSLVVNMTYTFKTKQYNLVILIYLIKPMTYSSHINSIV